MATCSLHTHIDAEPWGGAHLDYCPDCESGEPCLCDPRVQSVCQFHYDRDWPKFVATVGEERMLELDASGMAWDAFTMGWMPRHGSYAQHDTTTTS